MALKFNDTKRQHNRALVVDLLNLAFRWKHQGRSDYRYDLKKTIESLASSYKCGQIIITADWGSSTYRLNLLPTYKEGRKLLRKDQTDQDAMFFEEFIAEYLEAIKVLEGEYPVLRFEGVEADDIAAHVVNNKDRLELEYIWLISSDRDWDLLVQDGVSRWSYVTRKEITLDNWSEHYEVEPEDYISYKCLMGDKGDDVPGIEQVGPKRATELIETYGSAFDIYNSMPLPGKYKYIQNINDSGDLLLLNYELMDLITYCDNAIGQDNIEEIACQLGITPKV